MRVIARSLKTSSGSRLRVGSALGRDFVSSSHYSLPDHFISIAHLSVGRPRHELVRLDLPHIQLVHAAGVSSRLLQELIVFCCCSASSKRVDNFLEII